MSERALHGFDDDTERLAHQIFDYVIDRVRMSPPAARCTTRRPPTSPRPPARPSPTTASGGSVRSRSSATCWHQPASRATTRAYLGFVPTAPAEAATLFDLVVSASSIYGDWWIEGAGAIHAENQALRWLAGLAGLPETAGGVFLSGGTAGNLTAMTVARETWRERAGPRPRRRHRLRAQRPLLDPARREGHRHAGRARGARRTRPPDG